MFNLLTSFTPSFVLALLAWPFLAAILTFPVLLSQYIHYHRIITQRVIITYLLMLYILGLAAITLYPFPNDPQTFCLKNHLTPQLKLFQFISDIINSGKPAVLQAVLNLVFFIPLGVFAKNYFGWKIGKTILAGFLTSLLIEVGQLTGAFFLYPCSYRLFDVDDLLINTCGAIIGFGISFVLPDFSKFEINQKLTTEPGLLRRSIIFLTDMLITCALTILTSIIAYLSIPNLDYSKFVFYTSLGWFIILQLLVPLLCKGQTIISRITMTSLDDLNRGWFHRTLFYILRTIFIGIFLFFDWNQALKAVILIISFLFWVRYHRLPYYLIDWCFKKTTKVDLDCKIDTNNIK